MLDRKETLRRIEKSMSDWPYLAQCPEYTYSMLKSAHELLTPRILRLDEIHRGMAVWMEYKDEPNVILAIGGASAGGAKCFITEDDRSVALLDKDYNVRWRAWTQEPTEEQRKEVQCG